MSGLQRPPASAYVNQYNPLGRNVLGCWTGLAGTGGTLFDHARVSDVTLDSGVTWTGIGMYPAAGAGGRITAPGTFKLARPITLAWFGRVRVDSASQLGNNPYLIGVSYDSSDSSPYAGYAIARRNNGQPGVDLLIQWNGGGSYTEQALTNGTASTGLYSIVAVFTSTDMRAYVNGVLMGTNTNNATTPNYSSTSQLAICRHAATGNTNHCNADLGIALVAARAWSPADAVLFAEDPFLPLRPVRKYYAFPLGSNLFQVRKGAGRILVPTGRAVRPHSM